jgi:chlorite dismutase
MTTREVYYKVYAASVLPVALIQFTTKDKDGVIQLGKSVAISFEDKTTGHEDNIRRMEKIASKKDFLFWNNSPEGEEFFKTNAKELGEMIAKIILSQGPMKF